jgi:RNA polymerase-binding transcription factor DksA
MDKSVPGPSAMDILRRIVDPEVPLLSAEAARGILSLDFSAADRERMNQLAARNREGRVSPAEEQELRKTEITTSRFGRHQYGMCR